MDRSKVMIKECIMLIYLKNWCKCKCVEIGFGSSKVERLIKWECEGLTTLGSLNGSHLQ